MAPRPSTLIYDEVAQWPGGQIDAMLSALETSRGKLPELARLMGRDSSRIAGAPVRKGAEWRARI